MHLIHICFNASSPLRALWFIFHHYHISLIITMYEIHTTLWAYVLLDYSYIFSSNGLHLISNIKEFAGFGNLFQMLNNLNNFSIQRRFRNYFGCDTSTSKSIFVYLMLILKKTVHCHKVKTNILTNDRFVFQCGYYNKRNI